MIHLHREALVVIGLVVAVFVACILMLAVCLGCNKHVTRHHVHPPRRFETLQELLYELEDTETGVLLEEEGREISLDSFFPDILHDKTRPTRPAAEGAEGDNRLDEPLI